MIVTVGALAMAAEDGAEEKRSLSVGVGAGVGLELQDETAKFGRSASPCVDLPTAQDEDEKRCPPVLHLLVPVRIPVLSDATLRLTPTAVFGVGQDQFSWEVPISETETERRLDPNINRAFYGSLGLTAGPEVRLPVKGPVVPFFSGGVGLALAGVFHSNLQQPDLFDPEDYTVEELDPTLNPNTVSPYTIQPALAGDLALGVKAGPMWLELGYQLQVLGSARLQRSPREIDARREPFGWDTLRLSIGVSP